MAERTVTRKGRKGLQPTGKAPGRNGLLTAETRKEIITMLRAGVYLTHAAGAVGVSKWSVYRWLEVGREDIENKRETEHAKLVQEIEQARYKGATLMHGLVFQAARRDWRAAAWLLERQFPEDFGPPSQEVVHRHEGHLTARIEHAVDKSIEKLSDGELELLERTLKRADNIVDIGRKRLGDGNAK